MLNPLLILGGKFLSKFSKTFNLGSGSTWPGHIALSINKNFIRDVLGKNKKLKIVLIAGTNGKTTTSSLISNILQKNRKTVFHNESGANLLNGIASSILLHSNILSTLDYDYAIFEVDENSLPLVLNELSPQYIILLNLFRDQLDRYGEVDSIARKWKEAIDKLNNKSALILNADDPQISFLGQNIKTNVLYFGLNEKAQQSKQFSPDSIYCPNCGTKLTYKATFFSHLGDWYCSKCNLKRPKLNLSSSEYYPLPGIYNMYNTHAALLLIRAISFARRDLAKLDTENLLKDFSPAFGRQEIIEINEKKVHLFLSKNPTSFNQSLRTVFELGGKNVLFVLNDRIPDGKDVSWIWDTDIESAIDSFKSINVSGDRCYDMGLRIKYSIQNSESKIQNNNLEFRIIENLDEAIKESLINIKANETLYVLPTYSAMLEVRKILTGRKIL